MSLKKNSRRINRRELPEMSLNMNALMDVLTVLLFFLLKSISMGAAEINTPKDLKLPIAISEDKAENAVTVSVSMDELRANDKTLSKLRKGRLAHNDLESDQRTVRALKEYLSKEMNKRMEVYRGSGNTGFLPDAKILIQADKNISFSTLKLILHTVAVVGYSSYEFVVTKESST